jgi:hypothetical protein
MKRLGAGELLIHNLEAEASQQGLGKSNMLHFGSATLDLATKFQRLGGLIFRLFRGFGTPKLPSLTTCDLRENSK